jgi:DNA-binding NarL/FixJ family response regulator
MPIRVLIVEDHNLLRKGLHAMISDMPNYVVVGEAREGKEAVREAALLHPDLIVMDLSMQGMTGFEATTQIKRRFAEIRILVLTIHDNEEFVREALRVGADGYVLKGASFEEFALALNLIAQGKRFISNDISMQIMDNLLQGQSTPAPRSAWDLLSERERSILKLVAEGLTNRATGQFLCISPKTVEKHRASLMRKLGLNNAAELVLAAVEMGLVERAGPGSSHPRSAWLGSAAGQPCTAIDGPPALVPASQASLFQAA